jgi:uncharacterized membrane protein YgcG
MSRVAGILDVHDLHVWNISTGIPVLTAHVHIGEDADPTQVLSALEVYVRRIGIRHSTIQICNPAIGGESGSGSGSGGSSGRGSGSGAGGSCDGEAGAEHGHAHGHPHEGHGHGHGHGGSCDHDH